MVMHALTNEEIAKEFGDRFDHFTLTHFLIEVAQHLIKRGQEVTPWILLEEIRRDPNRYNLEELSKPVASRESEQQ